MSGLLAAFLISIAPAPAAELQNVQMLGDLERVFVERAKKTASCREDPAPVGKRIERVRGMTYDAITDLDPWPDFFSWFHIQTKDDVAARESLMQAGDVWDTQLAWETERNLIADYYVSMARLIPCATGNGSLEVLVVVKDLWSLRGSLSLRVVGGTLEEMQFNFGEFNIFGRNKSASVDFGLDTQTYSFGGTITDPRINGSRWLGQVSGSAFINRSTLLSEGGDFGLRLTRPLYSLSTEWAYDLSFSYLRGTYRLYSATAQLAGYTQTLWYLSPSVTRSFGRLNKVNVTVGYRGNIKRYGADGVFTAPRNEESGALFLGVTAYQARYRRYFDLETYILPEDYLLGPYATLEVTGATPVFGFSSSYLEPTGLLSYRSAQGDWLFYAGLSGGMRLQPEASVNGSPWVNRWLSLSARATTPHVGPLFAVVEGSMTGREAYQNPTFAVLGGATYLRGYPTNYFYGLSSWRTNFEIRTRPFYWSSAAIGAATYLDIGDAFGTVQDLNAHASIGAGLRFLFPEFNRKVLRIDFATPLEATTVSPAYFILTFGQGF